MDNPDVALRVRLDVRLNADLIGGLGRRRRRRRSLLEFAFVAEDRFFIHLVKRLVVTRILCFPLWCTGHSCQRPHGQVGALADRHARGNHAGGAHKRVHPTNGTRGGASQCGTDSEPGEHGQVAATKNARTSRNKADSFSTDHRAGWVPQVSTY